MVSLGSKLRNATSAASKAGLALAIALAMAAPAAPAFAADFNTGEMVGYGASRYTAAQSKSTDSSVSLYVSYLWGYASVQVMAYRPWDGSAIDVGSPVGYISYYPCSASLVNYVYENGYRDAMLKFTNLVNGGSNLSIVKGSWWADM